jgi:hypothetical protein
MKLTTGHKIVDLKNRIKASVVIWKRKMCAKMDGQDGSKIERNVVRNLLYVLGIMDIV